MNTGTGGWQGGPWWLAIDFGTSNTGAAVSAVGRIEAVPLTHAGSLMPTAVFVESPHRIDVGDVAANRALTSPAGFVPAPKRFVGMPAVYAAGYEIPASSVVAAVYAAVIDAATRVQGGVNPVGLVLTHPEDWSQAQLQVLVDAAQTIGFGSDRLRLVSEPRAAVAHYSRSTTLVPGSDVAVFDFGGGTLDVAVLRVDPQGGVQVVAARGDNGLGGRNFDGLIRRWVDEQLDESDPELLDYLRTSAPAHVLRTLDDSIERAKELLSSAPSASIQVVDGRADKQVTLSLTRDEFETLIGPEIDRGVRLAQAALADAGHGAGPARLSAVFLTGGSSRVPLVHQRLGALGPVATLDDPKLVVSTGALVAAGLSDSAAGSAAPAGTGSTTPAAAVSAAPQKVKKPLRPGRRKKDVAAATDTSVQPAAYAPQPPTGPQQSVPQPYPAQSPDTGPQAMPPPPAPSPYPQGQGYAGYPAAAQPQGYAGYPAAAQPQGYAGYPAAPQPPAPAGRKGMSKRKKIILIVVAIIIVFGILAAIFSEEESDSSAARSATTSSSATSTTSAAASSASSSATPTYATDTTGKKDLIERGFSGEATVHCTGSDEEIFVSGEDRIRIMDDRGENQLLLGDRMYIWIAGENTGTVLAGAALHSQLGDSPGAGLYEDMMQNVSELSTCNEYGGNSDPFARPSGVEFDPL